jgi:hypothetical protein
MWLIWAAWRHVRAGGAAAAFLRGQRRWQQAAALRALHAVQHLPQAAAQEGLPAQCGAAPGECRRGRCYGLALAGA